MSDAATREMLFDYQTTYKTDYHGGEIRPPIETKYKPRKRRERPKATPTKDVYTLTDWKGEGVPFALLHRCKDIVRTNPRHVQKSWEKPKDAGLADAIRSRPRLVMTPAVSMDDIEPRSREILVNNMYISDTTKAQRDAVSPYLSVKAPLPDLPASANPVTLPKVLPGYVSPEWRMDSVTWDNKQSRAYCHSTAEFWLRRKPPSCRKCDETNTITALRKAHKL